MMMMIMIIITIIIIIIIIIHFQSEIGALCQISKQKPIKSVKLRVP